MNYWQITYHQASHLGIEDKVIKIYAEKRDDLVDFIKQNAPVAYAYLTVEPIEPEVRMQLANAYMNISKLIISCLGTPEFLLMLLKSEREELEVKGSKILFVYDEAMQHVRDILK